MSNTIMAACWPLSMPATQKLVLVSLADHANDAGSCFPSIQRLCEHTGLSDRAIQKSIKWLESVGVLRRCAKPGRASDYVIDPAAFTPEPRSPRTTFTPNHVHPTPERGSPPPPNHVHPTPEPRSPITIREPSIEPSRNQKKERAGVTALCPPEVPAQVWEDWQRVRRAKKGGEVTATALAGLQREADLAGLTLAQAITVCCERSWVGFRADWHANAKPQARASPAEQRRERESQFIRELTGRHYDDRTVINAEPYFARIA
jgi:hypothetical protein